MLALALYKHSSLLNLLEPNLIAEVELGTLETEIGYGFKSLSFRWALSDARVEQVLDEQEPYWMAHAILSDGARTLFEGQIAELSEDARGVSCTTVGYYNALNDVNVTARAEAFSADTLAADAAINELIGRMAGRLTTKDVTMPSSSIDTTGLTYPAKPAALLKETLDRAAGGTNTYGYAIWEDRKLYTLALQPATTPNWQIRRGPGLVLQRKLTLDGFANMVRAQYSTSYTSAALSSVDITGRGFTKEYLATGTTTQTDAETQRDREAAARLSPARMGSMVLADTIDDMNGQSWPASWARAGDTVRLIDRVARSAAQRDFLIYHTSYDFAGRTLQISLAQEPRRLS